MPPITPTLGAGSEGKGKHGKVEQDMDGKSLGQVYLVVGQWPIFQVDPTSSFDQHSNFSLRSLHKAYRAFATTFEACEAAFYRKEHVLQVPGLGKHHDPDEFIANENINLRHVNYPDAAKVREDDETIKTSNRLEHSPPPSYEPSEQAELQGPLAFDPSPPDMEEEDHSLAAAADQAELM